MISVLRVVAGLSLLALLIVLLVRPLANGAGFQLVALSVVLDLIYSLAFAAGILGLVALAQRASWGWFTAVVLALALGILAPVIDFYLPAVVPFHTLASLVCRAGSACPIDAYVFLPLHALAPLIVLLSTMSRPQPRQA